MKIQDYINKNQIMFVTENDKSKVLKDLVHLITSSGLIGDEEEFLLAIKDREKILSTGIGFGIAIPHAKLETIKEFTIAIGISKPGIKYESLDEKDVHIIVMIAGPTGRQKDYLALLSRVLLILKNSKVRKKILECETEEDIYKIFLKY